MRVSIIGLSGLLLAASATPAFAQEEESKPITVSANVALTTDYRFRGIGFSDGDFAIQGGVDVNHESGFYVGAWGSSLEDSDQFGNAELDIYGGWSGDLTDGVSADVGLLYFVFPNGNETLGGPSDFFEPYASISADIGPASVTVGGNYAWGGQSALGDNDSIYVYGDVGVGIPDTPVSLSAHIGYADGSLGIGPDNDNLDYSIGAEYAITSNLTAGLSYIGTETDLPSVDGFNDDAVVFTLSASF